MLSDAEVVEVLKTIHTTGDRVLRGEALADWCIRKGQALLQAISRFGVCDCGKCLEKDEYPEEPHCLFCGRKFAAEQSAGGADQRVNLGGDPIVGGAR
jgi:hypothetical protein